MPRNAHFALIMVKTFLFAHLDTTRFLYHSPWLDEDQNQLKNDEAATHKWLQFRSGSGQLGVQHMVAKFYMPGEKGASMEQLAYGMVEKIARQTTSLEQIKIWTK